MLTGPTNFGGAGSTLASNSSGDAFGIGGNNGNLRVPTGYASGNPLAGTMTFNSATFASLGMTPGTYVWNWGSGDHADSFTLNIGAQAIPEPGSMPLCAVGGLLGIILLRRRRNRATA